MNVTVSGRTVSLTRDVVVSRLADISPEAARKYFVVFSGQEYPFKQALEVVSGIHRNEFISYHARSIFNRLGFSLVER